MSHTLPKSRIVLKDISLNIDRNPQNNDKKKNVGSKYIKWESTDSKKEPTKKVLNVIRSSSISKGKTSIQNEKRSYTALFIGNLPKYVTENNLQEIFGIYQSLVSLKICIDSVTRESLGYGYLNFENKKEAEKVMEEFNYKVYFGNELKIMPSLRNSYYRKNIGTNLFFCNLPLHLPELTTRKFYDTFRKYGNILSCKLDKRKNIGFVYFDNDQSAKQVIKEFNNKEFFGNKISCGLHFGKDVRTFPEFEKRKEKLDANDLITEELLIDNNNNVPKTDGYQEINCEPDIGKNYPNSVYVKNLPMSTTDEEILDFFSIIGPIKSVFSSKVPRFKSLWTIITYKKNSDAINSIEFYDNKTFNDRTISVTKAHSKLQERQNNIHSENLNFSEQQNVVYLSNLSLSCNEDFLTTMCKQASIEIEDVQVYSSLVNNSIVNSCYIRCKTNSDVTKVHELFNGKLIHGIVIQASCLSNFNNSNNSCINYRQYQRRVSLKNSNPDIIPAIIPPTHTYSPSYPVYYTTWNNSQLQPIQNTNKWKTKNNIINENVKTHVIESLKGIIKRSQDYVTYSNYLKDSDIQCIAEYILQVYWRDEVESLSNFMTLLNSNVQSQKILHYQIEEASRYLGFEK